MSSDTDLASVNWLDFEQYAVYGLGRSGLGACRLLSRRGKSVLASDLAERDELDGLAEGLPDDIECRFSENTPGDADLVVVSPGLSPHCDAIRELERRDIPYISELELAFEAADASILALTGTDGKTTTTSLLGEIAEASDRPSRVAGNIGTPLSDAVDEVGADGLLVVEVSANQLWTSPRFHPEVAGLTNVASDHLDYFESLESYHRAKRRLIQHATPSDATVFNDEDAIVRSWADACPSRAIGYGFERESLSRYDGSIWSDDESMRARDLEAGDGRLLPWKDFALPGHHNRLNAMCAAGMAIAAGLEPEDVERGLADAEPLAHRVESCDTVRGVTFYDDSKATNVNSALAGLQSIPHPFVAIVGGVDKGLELEPLVEYLGRHASGVAVIGDIQDRMMSALDDGETGERKGRRVATLEEAVRWAFETARPREEPVILSPACSSFDMFDDYVDRGEQFQRAISTLRDSTSQ